MTGWDRVHDLLDARRDPLADPQVQAWLEVHPDQLAEVVAVRAATATLAAPVAARLGLRLAVAAVVLLAAAAVALRGRWSGSPAPLPSPRIAAGGAVLSLRLEIEVLGCNESVRMRDDMGTLVRTRTTSFTRSLADPAFPPRIEVCVLENQRR